MLRTLLAVSTLLLALCLVPSPTVAEETPYADLTVSPEAKELARRIVDLPRYRKLMEDTLYDEFPESVARELPWLLAKGYQPMWDATRADLAEAFEALLSRKQIRTSLSRIDRDPDKVWNHHDEIIRLLGSEEQKRAGFRSVRQYIIVGCVFGAMEPALAQKLADVRASGEEFPIDEKMLERNADMVERAFEFCTCVMPKMREKFGTEEDGATVAASQEEQAAYSIELAEAGEC